MCISLLIWWLASCIMLFRLYQSSQISNITRVYNFLQELSIISSHNSPHLLSNQCFTYFVGAKRPSFPFIFRNHIFILHSEPFFGMMVIPLDSGGQIHWVSAITPQLHTQANITHWSSLFSLYLHLGSNAGPQTSTTKAISA